MDDNATHYREMRSWRLCFLRRGGETVDPNDYGLVDLGCARQLCQIRGWHHCVVSNIYGWRAVESFASEPCVRLTRTVAQIAAINRWNSLNRSMGQQRSGAASVITSRQGKFALSVLLGGCVPHCRRDCRGSSRQPDNRRKWDAISNRGRWPHAPGVWPERSEHGGGVD